MATLLDMVNDLRVLLREERISAITSTDQYTQALLPLINNAAKDVLESRTWSFDKRFDGEAAFPGIITPTTMVSATASTVVVDTPEADFTELFTPNALAVRFDLTDAAERSSLSYQVTSASFVFGSIIMTVTPEWKGGAVGTHTGQRLYAFDRVLPDTVRKVLSVRDEEQPEQLVFSEDETTLDHYSPKNLEDSGEVTSVVVGGTSTASYDSSAVSAGTVGTRMRVYPVPDRDTMIYYTYVYRHPAMSDTADTLQDVPDHIVDIIVDKALYYCFSSNIEPDPQRAKKLAETIDIQLALMANEDDTAPNRRRVLRSNRTDGYRYRTAEWR